MNIYEATNMSIVRFKEFMDGLETDSLCRDHRRLYFEGNQGQDMLSY